MPRRGSSKPPAEPVVKPYGCDFTAGVVGSAYKITNPKYIAANAYSAAAHPLQTLDRININGQDALNGVMGIADKVRNKEYGALARGAGYVAGNVAQAYLLSKGIEKCGDLLVKKRGETLLPHPPVDEGGTPTDTVWDNIKATQDNYPNNNIPKSFEIWYYVKKKYKLNVDFFAESTESDSAVFRNHVFQIIQSG